MTCWRLLGFTNTYIRLIVQAPAPSKCILLSTSAVVRGLMKEWVLSDAGDKWSVKLDTRYLGGERGGTLTLPFGRGVPLLLVGFLGCWLLCWLLWHCHLILLASLGFLWTKFLPGALHAIEGSRISFSLLRQLRSASVSAGLVQEDANRSCWCSFVSA